VLNLETLSGLPMALNEAGALVFEPAVTIDESKVRRLDELTPVALDPEACRDSHEIAYYMYNGIYLQSDAPRLAGAPLRYDLTLIPPRRIKREFVKTHGHLHSAEPGSGLPYAEVYEVLVGTAHFFFQTLDLVGPDAAQALYFEAKAGEKVLIPPGFDHLTINPGPGPLLFSDVMARTAQGIYERYQAAGGAAYLEVGEENGQSRFIPNPRYRSVAPLRPAVPRNYPALRLTRAEPLYLAFAAGGSTDWTFLTDPACFWSTFPDLTATFQPNQP
jgi:glucose-6-phosphate isomerase